MSPKRPRNPVEPLESRRLFAATVGVANHVLSVMGDARSSNTITVGLSADGASVVATVTYSTGRGAATVPHTVSQTFPLSAGLVLVRINGGNKADGVTIDQTHGSFPIPTNVHLKAGNDTFTGGDEPDAVWGQSGGDLLNGGAGNDSIFGMDGRDTLIGGLGNDFLSGGTSKDYLEGDAGNDVLYDPFGPDTVLGGDGSDTFKVHSLAKDTDNDYDAKEDTLKPVPIPSSGDDDTDLGPLFGVLPILF